MTSIAISRPVRWYDYLSINFYYLGLTTLSQTNGLVFPLLVQQFVGESVQGAYLGRLRLWTLMVALLMQAVWGMVSDRMVSRWGRRRPFIFFGTLADLVFIVAVGLSAGMAGMSGFWFLFVMAIFMQVSSNAAHAAQQGLIPDLVPERQRGKFSGVKAILELPIPLLLVSFTIAPLIAAGNLWAGLFLAMGVLVFAMAVTMLAPETAPEEAPEPFNWQPVLRLAVMAGLFTGIILGAGAAVQWIGNALADSDSLPTLVLGMGMTGLIGMLVAIGVGVWTSVRVSIGREAAGQNPSFTWWVINRLAFLVGMVNLSTFAVYFVQARLGYERETAAGPAAQLMAVVGVCILISALPSGWLADRFGRRSLVAISGIGAAVGVVIALLTPSLTLLFIGGSLIGLSAGLFYTANWALGTDLVPKAEAGQYLGISNLAGAGAGAVGAYIGGPIADYFTVRFPDAPGIGYVVLFGIFSLIFLLSVLALARVHEPHQVKP